MILSSDELEILEYLKSWKGLPIALVEISRCAGGRRKFRETPHWARGLMHRLVEAQLVEVNERGHYRALVEAEKEIPKPALAPTPVTKPAKAPKLSSVEPHAARDNLVSGAPAGQVIGGDYFPANEAAPQKSDRWISPQMADILKKSGKKIGGKKLWID